MRRDERLRELAKEALQARLAILSQEMDMLMRSGGSKAAPRAPQRKRVRSAVSKKKQAAKMRLYWMRRHRAEAQAVPAKSKLKKGA